MANLAYLKLSGIKGPSVIKSDTRLNHIGVLGVRHDVGTPPGEDGAAERLHHPIYVTKNIDFTTPALHRSLTDGTVFENGWINFFHMPRSGDESNYYSIIMTGIQVVSIQSVMPTTQDPNNAEIHEYEVVGLMYKGINWTSHSPIVETLEYGSYKGDSEAEPEAKFGPDWIEEAAEAEVTEILDAVKEKIKAALMAEAKKKADDLKKK
jgi:type VI secretion system secreted protein Hcp